MTSTDRAESETGSPHWWFNITYGSAKVIAGAVPMWAAVILLNRAGFSWQMLALAMAGCFAAIVVTEHT